MRLRRRLERLEVKRGITSVEGPRVIFLCSPGRGASVALMIGGETLSRHDGETELAFMERVEAIHQVSEGG